MMSRSNRSGSKNLTRWISGGFCLALVAMIWGLCTGCEEDLSELGISESQGWEGGWDSVDESWDGESGYTGSDVLETYLGNFIEYQ